MAAMEDSFMSDIYNNLKGIRRWNTAVCWRECDNRLSYPIPSAAPPPHPHPTHTQELKGGAKIAPGRLYVKIDHRRDEELGPTLNSGTVGVRLVER